MRPDSGEGIRRDLRTCIQPTDIAATRSSIDSTSLIKERHLLAARKQMRKSQQRRRRAGFLVSPVAAAACRSGFHQANKEEVLGFSASRKRPSFFRCRRITTAAPCYGRRSGRRTIDGGNTSPRIGPRREKGVAAKAHHYRGLPTTVSTHEKRKSTVPCMRAKLQPWRRCDWRRNFRRHRRLRPIPGAPPSPGPNSAKSLDLQSMRPGF